MYVMYIRTYNVYIRFLSRTSILIFYLILSLISLHLTSSRGKAGNSPSVVVRLNRQGVRADIAAWCRHRGSDYLVYLEL